MEEAEIFCGFAGVPCRLFSWKAVLLVQLAIKKQVKMISKKLFKFLSIMLPLKKFPIDFSNNCQKHCYYIVTNI